MTDDNKNDNINIKGDDDSGSTDPELLERGRVSASDKRNDYIRERGIHSEEMAYLVEAVEGNEPISAGDDSWLRFGEEAVPLAEMGLTEDILRDFSRIELKQVDSAGRHISAENQQKLKDTEMRSIWVVKQKGRKAHGAPTLSAKKTDLFLQVGFLTK